MIEQGGNSSAERTGKSKEDSPQKTIGEGSNQKQQASDSAGPASKNELHCENVYELSKKKELNKIFIAEGICYVIVTVLSVFLLVNTIAIEEIEDLKELKFLICSRIGLWVVIHLIWHRPFWRH